MKNIIKKWWFWVIIVIIAVIVIICIKQYIENKELKRKFSTMGQVATDFYTGIQNTEGYLNDFTYNYETEETEYHPQIILEKYNMIKEGMTEEKVINILGNGEKLEQKESNSYMITWGDLNLNNPPYYRIQIIFDKATKTVLNAYQLGLE